MNEATVVATAGLCLAAAGVVLGQAPVPVDNISPAWLNALGGLSGLALMVWFVRYVIITEIPRRDAAAAATMDQMRKDHIEEVRHIVDNFREEQAEARLAEAERNKSSQELARNGIAALAGLQQAVSTLSERKPRGAA